MTNEIYRKVLKAMVKTWLNNSFEENRDPNDVASMMMAGLRKYIGNCPISMLAFMEIIGEASDELFAEKEGLAVPNVKPEEPRRYNSDNWD